MEAIDVFLVTKPAKKSIFIGIVLVALEQFSGCFALLFSVASAFESSGATSISPEVGTIIVGFVQLIGAYCSTIFVDRLGRKPLLAFSAFGVSLGMITFGMATQMIEHGHTSTFIKLIPVLALSVSVFLANVGIFALTFVILPEISPEKVSAECFYKLV